MWANLWVKVRRLSAAPPRKKFAKLPDRNGNGVKHHCSVSRAELDRAKPSHRAFALGSAALSLRRAASPQREGGPGRLQHRPESGALFRHGRTCGCRGTRSSCRGTWCRASLAPTRRAARMHCSSSYKLIDEEPQLTCGLLPPMPLPLIAALASATAVPRIARGARQDAVRR